MPDYSKTIIYKTCCNDTEIKEIYVGSTCNLTNRRWGHKSICNNELSPAYNFKLYQFIRANGGWENWSLVMVDEGKLDNKLQKEKLEREWYEKLGATLNSVMPTRTMKEYRLTNKETVSEIKHKSYMAHREENLIKKKEYYDKNKEKLCIQKKEYYDKNKENINEKFVCEECGGRYTKQSINKHNKTKKHISKTASLGNSLNG